MTAEQPTISAKAMMQLSAAMNDVTPLGPIAHEDVPHEIHEIIIEPQVEAFRYRALNGALIITGRKGSGKSALLSNTVIDGIRSEEDRIEYGKPFIFHLKTWESFFHIVRQVTSRMPDGSTPSDLLPIELLEKKWSDAFWDRIILYFSNFASEPTARGLLVNVTRYIEADEPFQGAAQKHAENLFREAKNDILRLLDSNGSNFFFLCDTLEKYPVRHSLFKPVIGGMFRALTGLSLASHKIKVSFCVPEEMAPDLLDGSENILKDWGSSHKIRWKPIELLRVVAHRYRLLTKIQDPDAYEAISSYDLSRREDLHSLFDRLLPNKTQNRLGEIEDPLAYVIRHTQLLPRHAIMIFNRMLSRAKADAGGWRRVSEESMREGVSDAEDLIARHILQPYFVKYPRLLDACSDILPDLNPICSNSDLVKIGRRFKGRHEDEINNVWKTLYQMGVIGRVVEGHPSEIPIEMRSARYCFGEFVFNGAPSLGMANDQNYCFHPVFTRFFRIPRRDTDDRRVVYPSNTEMVMLK